MTTTVQGSNTDEADQLRQAMADALIAEQAGKGRTIRPEVVEALRTVPRHLFAPNASLADAYKHDSVVRTKWRGPETISSVSAPWLQTEMIGQAADALGGLEGRHVLEIGSGGYNAALLRELTGPSGSVTTVDIDADVTDQAAASLAAAGYNNVTVVCADAEQPVEPVRVYDLVLVTVGAWDIPPAWIEQLSEGGVLVVPLRTWGMTRSWALRRDGDRLISQSQRLCGFVSMQGAGEHHIRFADIAPGVNLRLDEGENVDQDTISAVLAEPREEAWAGLSLPARTMLSDLNLWLVARIVEDGGQFVTLTAGQDAIDAGTVTPSWLHGTPANYQDGTFCYKAKLRWDGNMFDLGACAHGPAAATAARQMIEQMIAWVGAGMPAPVLHVAPASAPGTLPAGTVLNKAHTQLVLTFTAP